MLSTIIWLVGLILAIKAALEIWNLNGDTFKKVVFVVLVLICSWVGLLVYYLFARDKMIEELSREMREAAARLEFEQAAYLRDRIKELRQGS